MPNPASSIALTYKGNDLQHADFGIFLEIVEGLESTADHRGVDTTVPSLPGQIEGNRLPHRRAILLEGIVKGSGLDPRADLRDNLQLLSTWFDPATPGDLVATVEDGDVYTIRARTEPPSPMTKRVNPSMVAVSIQLISVAPDWTIT